MVPCGTPWGRWYQTLEEVFIEVQVPPGTRAKDICCNLQSQHIALSVRGQDVLQVLGRRGGNGDPPRLATRGRREGPRGARWVTGVRCLSAPPASVIFSSLNSQILIHQKRNVSE